MKISICIITYTRPQGLQRLLDGIGAQRFQKHPAARLEVVVVDNDPAASARAVCTEAAARLPWPLRYEVEANRGIPQARNRAVASVDPATDFVVFVDDDEVPAANWIDELLDTQARFGADVVSGPVEPYFPTPPPRWAEAGGFYRRPRYPTGHVLPTAATNNVLVRREVLDRFPRPFNEAMALTGGTDTYFFDQVHRAGYSIVWADEAVVEEWVPESRVQTSWVVKRAYRTASGYALREVQARPRSLTRVLRFASGAVRTAQAALLMPFALLRRERELHYVLLLQLGARGVGMMAGALGWTYEEYRKVHSL